MLRLQWRDTPDRYGPASRWLHWGIGALLLWQLGGMTAKALLGSQEWIQLWIATHRPLGTLLIGLVALRASWALLNLPRRPTHRGTLGRLAALSHLLLYLLMLTIPALGLYMTWRSGQPFAPWGIPLFEGGTAHVDSMLFTRRWHGWLGWTLLGLIIGHAGMALLWHGLVRRDGTLGRMAGNPRQ